MTVSTKLPTAAVSVSSDALERSFLRHLIPLRLHGDGSVGTLYRHAFLHQSHLIQRVLGALESVPLPPAPRLLFAEAFQRLLEGQSPMREVRAVFAEAEQAARMVLLDAAFRHKRGAMESAVRGDPLTRLLAYELRAGCGFYTQLLAIGHRPEVSATALLRTLIAADVRGDPLLSGAMLQFEAIPRDPQSGERRQTLRAEMDAFVKECLLLERDAFGRFRFDPRGDNRHWLHCLKLHDITRTPRDCAVILDPVVRRYGNFRLERVPVFGGRWMEHRFACAAESHRVDGRLPTLETVRVRAGDGKAAREEEEVLFHVWYDAPICPRHKETTREKDAALDHEEVFELAVENTNRGFWERWFMDR